MKYCTHAPTGDCLIAVYENGAFPIGGSVSRQFSRSKPHEWNLLTYDLDGKMTVSAPSIFSHRSVIPFWNYSTERSQNPNGPNDLSMQHCRYDDVPMCGRNARAEKRFGSFDEGNFLANASCRNADAAERPSVQRL
jgi:hypothetical protein